MNLIHCRFPRMLVPLPLTWSYHGLNYRATCWPEVRVERQYGCEWLPVEPARELFTGAATSIDAGGWRSYLRFVPPAVRRLVAASAATRLETLIDCRSQFARHRNRFAA